MKRVLYLKTGAYMWFYGMEEGKYCIGLTAHATILVSRDEIEFIEN